MPKPQPTPPEHLQWILGGTHTEAWTRAAEWLHANSHADAPPVARAAASDPCEDCWHAAVFATKGVVLAGYQNRDQVLTETAAMLRAHCPQHTGGDTAFMTCQCPAATELERAARTSQES